MIIFVTACIIDFIVDHAIGIGTIGRRVDINNCQSHGICIVRNFCIVVQSANKIGIYCKGNIYHLTLTSRNSKWCIVGQCRCS